MKQTTIRDKIKFSGVGLHSGVLTEVELCPLDADSGIIFQFNNTEVEALYSNVVDTNLGTTIAKNNVKILTIEHLMAALWACNIDNLLIKITAQETPIMDGSSKIFIEKIENIGTKELEKDKKYLKILKKIEVKDNDKIISIEPSENFSIDITVEYLYGAIGKQNYIFDGSKDNFKNNIALARTFCHEKEIEYMRSKGLAKGGTLDNAMVFTDNDIINKGGFRCDEEVVKHKLLDCIGDIYTSGYNIIGKITSFKGGHTLNNLLLKKIFESKENFVITN